MSGMGVSRDSELRPARVIELARGRGIEPTADLVADIVVPGGALPDDHPDYLTDRDPWSVAWDEADALLHSGASDESRATFRCAECGAEYLRSSPREKYCSDWCRKMARRARRR